MIIKTQIRRYLSINQKTQIEKTKIKNKLNFEKSITGINSLDFSIKNKFENKKYTIRHANEKDISEVTYLIQKSFSYWKEKNIPVRSAYQTEEITMSHILNKKGFVIEDKENFGKIVATVSMEYAYTSEVNDSDFDFFEGEKRIRFERIGQSICFFKENEIKANEYLFFKKLCVDPDLQKNQIGKTIGAYCEKISKQLGFEYIAIETAVEANWLYQWYIKMGFKTIAQHKISENSIKPVLMVKKIT